MRLVIACDHGGFELKRQLLSTLEDLSAIEVEDLGVHSADSVDYPDLAHALAAEMTAGKAERGVLICGTGLGMSIAANRHRGVRAALCTDPYMARMAREHNDANVLCLGGRVVGPGLADSILEAFLGGEFAGDRHARRVGKLDPPS
ncbi:MAG: ribose 5-phosphate isomerase B [Polyangia bacterium]